MPMAIRGTTFTVPFRPTAQDRLESGESLRVWSNALMVRKYMDWKLLGKLAFGMCHKTFVGHAIRNRGCDEI